ncbi:hypothetical protein DPMN_025433 [Dreissena polymorpha]|uniref:Uncharacterized protein n=1 Tax=Dreissena polymorpha TaxID=45954 RepID=A0A9D4LTA3_DREPO|nr:hypothetical protein DPMN_025433 [Dreissena polymorpha]
MVRQRPTRAPHVEIDRIVIREVQYQLEVNRCRNKEIIVKDNFGLVWPIMGGASQDVQYQFDVNRCRYKEIIVKGNFRWAWPMWMGRPRVGNGAIHKVQYQFEWPMWAGRPRINCIVIREVQYKFKVNRCRNEEIIVKGNFEWAWPMWAGRPRIDRIVIREAILGCHGLCGRVALGLVMGPCIAEIDHIVIREVQYQFEVNRCRNEEIIVKGNFGWAWTIWPGRPRIDLSVIREAQYQFKVNRCRNEEVNFQGSSANSVGGAARYIIRTNVLTKFHEEVLMRISSPPPGGHIFHQTGITLNLIQDIFKTKVLAKFNEDF